MTPKQKAEDLITSFRDKLDEAISYEESVKCSILCVEEIINLMSSTFNWSQEYNGNIHYWQEVKQELENNK